MNTTSPYEVLPHTGPGTPCGNLMRRYWQPAALSEELPTDGPPLPIRLMGEDLVLYRDEKGHPGLIGLHCPHRGADLSYGRLEDGGLRCIYHGWLFDHTGKCLEQPGEPAGSTYHERIQHGAYPCQEVGQIIFAYLGPGEAPLLPAYEFLSVPEDQRYVTKAWHECNYLQGNEGNIDPDHLSFLHRMFREGADWASPQPVQGGLSSSNTLFGHDIAPVLEVEETEFGLRILTVRDAGQGMRYLRVSNFILPNLAAFPGGGNGDGYSVNWHVPIDDENHWKFFINFRRDGPVDKDTLKKRTVEMTPDYRLVRNKANRYLQDRDEMKDRTYAGVGTSFMVHDACVTEPMGGIQNRSEEHLGTTDKAIVAARSQMLRALQLTEKNQEPPHVIRDSASNSFPLLGAVDMVIRSDADWKTCWQGREALALAH